MAPIPQSLFGCACAQQYPIQATKEDSDEDDVSDPEEEEEPKEKIPAWASSARLQQSATSQISMDADEIFGQQVRSAAPSLVLPPSYQWRCSCAQIHNQAEACSLGDIFGRDSKDRKEKRWHRRTSSGNWNADRLTAEEERNYKAAMCFSSAMGL